MPRTFKSHQPKPARWARDAKPAPALGRSGAAHEPAKPFAKPTGKPKEIGGPSGPEPTRYGDWERKGICVDF